jgi:hypothetical protein
MVPPAPPGPASQVERVGALGASDAARIQDERTPGGVERDVVRPPAPTGRGESVDPVDLPDPQREVAHGADPAPVGAVEAARLVAHVVEACAVRHRVGVRHHHVDRPVSPADVLRVRALVAVTDHERSRLHPAEAVLGVGERRVPVPAAPEQPQFVLAGDWVGVRVAESSGRVRPDVVLRAQAGLDVVEAPRRAVVHFALAVERVVAPGMGRVERPHVPAPEDEARVVVVVDLGVAMHDHLHGASGLAVDLVDDDLAAPGHAADEHPIAVCERARVAEVRPRAVVQMRRGHRARARDRAQGLRRTVCGLRQRRERCASGQHVNEAEMHARMLHRLQTLSIRRNSGARAWISTVVGSEGA